MRPCLRTNQSKGVKRGSTSGCPPTHEMKNLRCEILYRLFLNTLGLFAETGSHHVDQDGSELSTFLSILRLEFWVCKHIGLSGHTISARAICEQARVAGPCVQAELFTHRPLVSVPGPQNGAPDLPLGALMRYRGKTGSLDNLSTVPRLPLRAIPGSL